VSSVPEPAGTSGTGGAGAADRAPAPVGVVLCGGASSRMGTDKALLGPPGHPLAGRVVAALIDAGVDGVVLVGGDGPRLRSAVGGAADWVPDQRPGEGPLAAMATAAAARPGRDLVVCSCDLPSVTGADLGPVLAALVDGAPAAVPEVDGRRQWSVVALSAPVAAGLGAAVERGERAPHRVLGALVATVAVPRPERLRDADQPRDLPPDLRPA
jgi:molybdenum cofactor guanylyltransferase